MRFRLGLALGFGAGYVLGTKAGRERYEQIKGWADGVMSSPRLESVRTQAEYAVQRAAERLPDKAKDKLPGRVRIPEPEMAAPQEPFSSPGGG